MSSAAAAQLIATAPELEAAVRRWRSASELALDTEFVFERTFRPRPGLVQVATAAEVALVDAVALPDLGVLGALLRDEQVLKIRFAAPARTQTGR